MHQPLMKSLSRIGRASSLYRQHAVGDTGLTGYQISYLTAIARHAPVTQDQLVPLMYVNKSSVARQLARLERHGYVRRTPDPDDRRKLLVELTPKAQDILPALARIDDAWKDTLLRDLDDEERRTLVALLSRVEARAVATIEELGLDREGGRR